MLVYSSLHSLLAYLLVSHRGLGIYLFISLPPMALKNVLQHLSCVWLLQAAHKFEL